jgi:hypothetical protein
MANPPNPTSIEEAVKIASTGTQWFRVGDGKGRNTQNLRKTKDGFIVFESGKPFRKVSQAEAIKFFRTHGLNNCNKPWLMPKPKPTVPAKKKTPPATKGAPKPKEEKPKEEELPPAFDDSDILLAQSVQGEFDQANFEGFGDWRVRLSLAPNSNYLYDGPNPGIMQPLQATNGVVFPYTPTIQVNYNANYNAIDLTHSNYKVQQYTNSSVDNVTITCDFTAQDVYEARYLLAVIHFFKTMTKMFYGQDQYPVRGTPPPLCYMFGLGGYQFSAHPLGITSFNYSLPNDVDYIKTTAPRPNQETETLNRIRSVDLTAQLEQDRLGTQCQVGGLPPPPKFSAELIDAISTWVPTKISLTIGCVPIMSRNQVSNYFSLNEYGSGALVNGVTRLGGGFW